jgi:hypothetical protein
MRSFSRLVIAAILLSLASTQANAVILYRSATRNISAPGGTNYNSGWQWQGNWAGGFTGTPIAPKYFITAGHIGGGVGQNIWFGGKNHLTTQMWDDPSTDLRIYKIADTFNTYAPIYTGTAEAGKRAMIFGRGTTRSSEVRVGTELKGWKHGTQDKVRSWGENMVSGSVNFGAGYGNLLKMTFNRGGLYNEGGISGGDSAGGMFINDGGKWKLAGINYLVEGPFSLTSGGSTFFASLYDKGGLYQAGVWNGNTAADVPMNFYATRISSRASWIKGIIGTTSTASAMPAAGTLAGTRSVPEPASAAILAMGAAFILRRRRRV